jgi:hypothetical protein
MYVLLLLILGLGLASPGRSAPEDEFIVAAMRLSEDPNYRWRTAVNDNARTYVVEGRVAAGYSWVRLPLVESIALRLPPMTAETIEAVFKGPARCALLTPAGWQKLQDLPRQHEAWDKDQPRIRLFAAGNLRTKRGPRPYSNAQFALDSPHDELAVIVSSYHELKVEGGEASGLLSNLGAQLLLVSDGQEQLRPVVAAGRFKVWLAEGNVEKYQLELVGVLLVEGQECLVQQTSTTVLADIGRTSLAIPAPVRQTLER